MAPSVFGTFGDAVKQAGGAFGQALKGNGREDPSAVPEIHIDLKSGRGVELMAR